MASIQTFVYERSFCYNKFLENVYIFAFLAKSHAKRERVLNLNNETERSNGLKYTEINVQKDFRWRQEVRLQVTLIRSSLTR